MAGLPRPSPSPVLHVPAPPLGPRPRQRCTPPTQLAAPPPPPLPRPGPVAVAAAAPVRPGPARQGQPASARDFERSSAGGAASHLGGHGELTAEQARKRARWGDSYVPAEETIRNDYSGQYVQTGNRPQNHLRNTAVETRFSEYPKLATLLAHKHALTASPRHSIPPTYLDLPATADPSPSRMAAALASLSPARFDAILLTPPPSVSYAELAALDLGARAATPGFVWLWVGSGQAGPGAGGIGLEKGRELLTRWGYRRCEDIVWLKTNTRDPERDLVNEPVSLFNPTIEHCLMGIRGTVRRSTDSFLVHCNVDTDVIVWEGDEADPDLKPPELQSLIENFCLGTRRLHLYGSPRALRRGWLTVAASSTAPYASALVPLRPVEREGTAEEQDARWGAPREWNRDEWEARWRRPGPGAGAEGDDVEEDKVDSLLPFVEELDTLRPKSPPPRNGLPSSGGLGRGRGAGLGITRSGLVPAIVGAPPNGLGRGRGRGRRDGPGPGPALLPPSVLGAALPPPSQLDMHPSYPMHRHHHHHPQPLQAPYPSASAPSAAFLGAPSPGFPGAPPSLNPHLHPHPHYPQHQQQQQGFFPPPPPPSAYTPSYGPPHLGWGATYGTPVTAPAPYSFPPTHAVVQPFPPLPPQLPPPAPPQGFDPTAHLVATHLAGLHLAQPGPARPVGAGVEHELVYPIGGPRGDAWEDAGE
ncbi:hypothetical protein JCM3770_004352 [Rhodotorula araucariae]